MKLPTLFTLVFLLTISNAAFAEDFKKGDLHIKHAYARATVPNQPAGAAYITLINTGKTSDKLTALTSPVAKNVDMHTMSMTGDMMKMREVENIEIKPATEIAMAPGDGFHLMLTGLKKPLKTGDKFPLTLTFQKAGKVTISVVVEDVAPPVHKH